MAREIINVTVKTKTADVIKIKTDVLAVGFYSDGAKFNKLSNALDVELDGAISKLVELGDFEGKCGSTAVVYGNGEIGANRVLLIGLGERKNLTVNCLRKAASIAANKTVKLKVASLAIAVHQGAGRKISLEAAGQAVCEGVYFGSYRYDEFVTDEKDGRLNSLDAVIVDSDSLAVKQIAKGVKDGNIIGQAQSYARTIANRPGNVINPATLAAEAKKIAKAESTLSCKVFDEKELIKRKAGGILAVGSGSAAHPAMIILKYTPAKRVSGKTPVVALVGKAITFDSGGISIKPSANMQDMKFDKSGGVAVLGAMKAIAALKPAVNVYGIIPAAENMPDGSSYRPGDIVTTLSGKTVEIHNTDAEGRMILCDAIHYATTEKCEVIVDIATLTGACVVALGKHMAGLMGNDDNLIKQIEKASAISGEKVWHLPSGKEYLDEMKSDIADLKNTGSSRWGGAITAGAFLGSFAGDAKWAHIDMAGMDMFKDKKFGAQGSGGFGVRLLTAFVMNVTGKGRKR